MGAGTRGKAWRWRSRRVLLVGILAVALIGVGGYVFTHRAAAETPVQDRTVAATLGTMQQTVSATGTIEPATQSDLSFQASGTVQTLSATVGQHVTKGARLATIDDTTLQSAVTLAQAQLTQAQAQVTDSASTGTASQIASANAQVAAASARLDAAKAALAEATLTSPIDGTVAAVNLQVGEPVGGSSGNGSSGIGSSSGGGGAGSSAGGASGGSGAASAASSSGASITVISTQAWVVSTQVTNADLPSLKPGLQVQVLPTGARTPIFGTVKSIGIVATSSSSGVAQFPVTVAVTGKPTGLYAGTSASVSIIVRQLADVLTVPTLAVRTEEGKTVVTVRANGKDTTTPVTVGQVFGAQTQVTVGLSEGELVVLPATISSRFGGTGTGGTGGTGRTGTGRTGTGGFGGGGFGGGGFGGGGFGGGGLGGGGFGGGNRTANGN